MLDHLRMKKLIISISWLLLLFTVLPSQSIHAKSEHDIELWNVIKPLETTVSFVNTGAHPDDERSDFLAYLSRGRGIETHSIIATRGEGGQNQIGKELGNALGVIRTNEMAEAAEITNVQAHHLSKRTGDSIYDFGFSKTPEETLEMWGEEETYKRFIRLIRELKPDIIMPSFRDVDTQHGHHRAMTVLSMRAFKDAADPNVFPEQISDEGLSPWQPKKLYLPSGDDDDVTHSFEIGIIDPVYDMTYPQIGEKSRSLHKSQGMGVDLPIESRQFNLELIKNETNDSSDDFFGGIPYDFQEWAQIITDSEIAHELKNLQDKLEATIDAYPNRSDIFTASQEALEQLESVQDLVKNSDFQQKDELQHKLSIKKEQLTEANFVAANLEIDIDFDSTTFVQGQEVEAEITIENKGDHPINDLTYELIGPKDWNIHHGNNKLHVKRDENDQTVVTIQAPEDANYYNPYADPIFNSNISYSVHDTEIEHTLEVDETIAVLPEIGLTIDPEDLIINTTDFPDRIPVTVEGKNYTSGALEANVRLNIPEDWEVVDQNQKVKFSKPNETKELTFELSPPRNISKDEFEIDVEAEISGKVLTDTVQEISYDHIDQSYYIYPSKINGSAFELLYDKELTIGYIDSGMDEVSKYLSDLGLNITEVTEEELSSGDLDKYDTIFTGIRAYLAREDLNKYNDQLLKYVKDGGHLVVQHNLPGEWDENHTAPYSLKLGTPSIDWRVTDQDSDVEILNPDSTLFHYPNNINKQDWENWVQERGLYFPMKWDDRYETFVSMADPEQEEPFTGGILATDYGEGTYIYTSLVFYRQIQNQVPGGYRIFTNLLHYLQDDPSLTITNIESFDPIVVDIGTSLSDLHFPTNAEVTLSDDSKITIPVHWDEGDPSYDKNIPEKYVFTGTLQLPEDIVNEENLKPEIIVHVKDKKEKTKEEGTETEEKNETSKDEKGKQDDDGDRDGKQLPKTATQSYNMLLIGSLVLIIGLSTYIWYRFRKRQL